MTEPMFDVIDAGNGKIVKAWKRGVPFDDNTIEQLKATAQLPFIFKNICAMPDAHLGSGSTIGTVLPTKEAICPAAVGVDIGCGMLAVPLAAHRSFFKDLPAVRKLIEDAVPHGRTDDGGEGDRGAWHNIPAHIQAIWDAHFAEEYEELCSYQNIRHKSGARHLGTLGTGNHFIELSTDENGDMWLILHSGSRGLGNKIGTTYTRISYDLCQGWFINLPHRDLAYLPASYAWTNRLIMRDSILTALNIVTADVREEVHCHHNYISWERHYGEDIMITRKGAVRADAGVFGIIPGSMGARTYIVRGLGSQDSFCTCSHGAGRTMSRTQAEKTFTVEQLIKATEGVECDKTEGVLDESPACYKDIEAVMAAQADLVEKVHTLKQFVCVKGIGDKGRRGRSHEIAS